MCDIKLMAGLVFFTNYHVEGIKNNKEN